MDLKNWKAIATVAGALTALFVAFQTWGIELPRPALTNDLEILAADLEKKITQVGDYARRVDRRDLEQSLESLELRVLQYEETIKTLEAQGIAPSPNIIQQKKILERKQQAFQRDLEALPPQ